MPKPPKGRKPPTLKDVASKAGVDPSVVSRIVNHDPNLTISNGTRERVLSAIDSVGYRPNLVARSLRTGRSLLVGFLVPDLSNPMYPPLIEGAQAAAAKAGYFLVVVNTNERQDNETLVRDLLDQQRVDGLLLASALIEDVGLGKLAATEPRILAVNRLVPGAASAVLVDDGEGSRIAAEHLRSLGHERIGAVLGPSDIDTTDRRKRGFLAGLGSEASKHPQLVYLPRVSPNEAFTAAGDLLRTHADITAIFSSTLLIGIGVQKAVLASGRRIPEDVSVIALNDHEIADFLVPPLATVALPYREMGYQALERLLRRLDGTDQPGEIIVNYPQPHLKPRGSTGPAPR